MKSPEINMFPNEPEVADFQTNINVLTVMFGDGHKMSTLRNTGGSSPSNNIETFLLTNDTQEVALYQSPYQYPRNTDSRNGFVFLKSDYTVEQVAEYWSAADKHIRGLVNKAGGLVELGAQNETALESFHLISHGHNDMLDVMANRVEIHTRT